MKISPPYISISVVIPALNEDQEIEKCLQSLRNQSFSAFEIIVVDNGSTDDTVAVAHRFGCRVVHEARRGISYARQRGFDAAYGKIIASTDADTITPPDWLFIIYKSFAEDPECVGVYGTIRLQDKEKIRYGGLVEHLFTLFLRLNQRLGRPHFCGPNFAVRKDIFEKVLGFRKDGLFYRKAEDLQLSLKLKEHGRVRFIRELVVYTSPRKLSGLKYLWSNAQDYFAIAWGGQVR